MTNKTYTPCHVHTSKGSIGDSIIHIKRLVSKAVEYNIKSLCITNHGSLADMYDFYYECIKNNINPIIGCEIYLTDDMNIKTKETKSYHLILLAKNIVGVKNLLKIVSEASITGFYKRPRVDLNYISQHSEGLICTTACVGGYLPKLILKDDIDDTDKQEEIDIHITKLKHIFKDDLYFEIQPGNFIEQTTVNHKLIELSNKYDVKLVVSNDIHYLNKVDWKVHDFHVRIHKQMKEPLSYEETVYPDKCYYLMTYDELLNSFSNDIYNKDIIIKAIDNTNEIADKCNIVFEHDKLNLPEFETPDGYTPKRYIEHLCFRRLDEIKYKLNNSNIYIDRIYEELEVLEELGFLSYFLIMWDLIKYARDNDIEVGPGRGSVGGSIIAYLLQITKVDSIKYDLMFARFLDKERKGSIPDVDVDFISEKREFMFDYSVEKYGLNKCAAVSTFGMRKAKTAIKDVARLMNINLKEAEAISKLIPMVYYGDGEEDKLTDLSIQEALDVVPELKPYQIKYPDLFIMAIKLEGLARQTSIHAAGTLISNTDIVEVAPLIRQGDKELLATSFDLSQAETGLLVKYDYLGLSTLDTIYECRNLTGDNFDIEFDDTTDKKVWDTIGSENTTGIFQISSKTYKERMGRLQPKTIEELAACLALVRGPCISAKTDELYMQIIEGKETIHKVHPIYDEVTKDTNGIMIYQEQLLKCCNKMGLPLSESYKLMKRAAKKDFKALASYEEQLWDLSKDKMDRDTFDTIFKLVVDSGKYSFEK